MSLQGLLVELTLVDDVDERDGPLYVGVFGKHGGREFLLQSGGLKAGSRRFVLGTIWEAYLDDVSAIHPPGTDAGQVCDPAAAAMPLDSLEYVYIRRDNGGAGLALELTHLEVRLYGTGGAKQEYVLDDQIVVLGGATGGGEKVWIPPR